MASAEAAKKKAPVKPTKVKMMSTEEIYNGFQALRAEQRGLIQKLQEVEMDLSEHQIVLDTLKDLDGDRKCFRLIGGVLCEKTVKEVMPTLASNRDQLTVLVEALNNQIAKKGEEINEFKGNNNIQIRGQDELPPNAAEGDKSSGSQARNSVVVNPSSY